MSFPTFSTASASRSFATIRPGFCLFRRSDVTESLRTEDRADVHPKWIRISNAASEGAQESCNNLLNYFLYRILNATPVRFNTVD
jgi:hypothetical protein